MIVDTPGGPVRGAGSDGFARFGGVPYARAVRFGFPEPVSWREPLDARRPGAAPPQVVGGLDLVPGMVPARQSEECLTVEVCAPWPPAPDADGAGGLPVIVWVPGGSYRIGGAGLATYDGGALAREQVVVVGVNYRLGALGWLAAEGVPTNLGLRDLAAAVAWVRAAAPAFGGDPGRIVLMGESAGAGALAHLLATGDVDVAGAILQSGAPAATLDAPTAEWVGSRLSEEAGVADVDALRALPVDALLGAQERTVAAALAKVGMMPFHPWIDHDLLDAAPWRGPLAPVALVVGTNAHEMELFRDQVPVLPEDVAVAFLARKAGALGITGEARVRRGLDACGGDLTEAVADLDLHVPNELLARSHRAAGNDVWRSRFTWEAPGRRACHALDLPFTFGTLDVDGWRDFAGAHDPAADALSARMRRAFAAFARDGAPGDAGTAPWPRTELVHLGARPGFGDDVVAARVAVWLGER